MADNPNLNETQIMWENRSKISALEANMTSIAKAIDTIQNNHLVHIQASIERVEEKVQDIELSMAKTATTVALIVGIGSVALQLLAERFINF